MEILPNYSFSIRIKEDTRPVKKKEPKKCMAEAEASGTKFFLEWKIPQKICYEISLNMSAKFREKVFMAEVILKKFRKRLGKRWPFMTSISRSRTENSLFW